MCVLGESGSRLGETASLKRDVLVMFYACLPF